MTTDKQNFLFSSPVEKSERQWMHAFVHDNVLKKEAAEYQEQFSPEDIQRKLTNAKWILLLSWDEEKAHSYSIDGLLYAY